MGQEILYCFKCRKRLLGSDFDRGHAFQVERLASCSGCVSEFLQTLKPADREQLQARMAQAPDRKKASGPQPAIATPRRGTDRVPMASPRPAAPSPGGSALPIAIGVGVVVIVLIFLATRSGPEPVPPPRPPTPPVVRPDPPPDSPAARAAIQKARQQSKERPDDLAGQIRAWEQAVTAAEKTALYEEARRELGSLLLRRKEAVIRDRRELEEKARPLLSQEQFQSAVDLFQAARSRHELPEWTTAIDQRAREIRASAEGIYRPAKEKAKGSADAVRALRERVQKWGIAELIADLPEVPAPPAPPERPWTPLLAKGFAAFRGGSTTAWKFVDDALVRQPTGDDALQTRAMIEDGELRIRFEANGGSGMFFAVRQGSGETPFVVSIPTAELRTLKPGPHELIFVCKGPSVSATLDGQPRTVTEGKAKSGTLQFNGEADTGLRILSIDVR